MHWKIMPKPARSQSARKGARRLRFIPALEPLEDRRVLSPTSSLFVLDQTASKLTLSGDLGGSPLQQQGNGSLVSSYQGAIVAAWDLDSLNISFDPAGTALKATVTGNWQPNPDGSPGSAPADYGGQVTVKVLFFTVTAEAALRNVVIGLSTANPLPLSGAGPYSFPSMESLTVLQGTTDYNADLFGEGTKGISTLPEPNTASAAGGFESLGSGSYRLTVPISITVQKMVGNLLATLHIDGKIVAQAVLPVVNLSDGTTTSFNYSTNAIGGGGPVALEDPAAAVTYTPPGNLTSMTVTLTNHPDDTAEYLGYDLGNSGLVSNGYDPASGQLVITGSADPSVYQAVLRTITYENDSLTPDPSDRQIQFVVSDGTNTSVVRTTTVSVGMAAAPFGHTGFLPPQMVLLNTGLLAVSGSVENNPVRGTADSHAAVPLLDAKAQADGLAQTPITIPSRRIAGWEDAASRMSDEGIDAPSVKLLVLEPWALNLATH
jgi:hypothetical protein